MTTQEWMETIEKRLAHLEETLYFQDRLLEELHLALARQQKQLDTLETSTTRALQRLEALMDTKADAPVSVETPPHYEKV